MEQINDDADADDDDDDDDDNGIFNDRRCIACFSSRPIFVFVYSLLTLRLMFFMRC